MPKNAFIERHLGSEANEIKEMLNYIGFDSLDDMTNAIIPDDIQIDLPALPKATDELDAIQRLEQLGKENQAYKNYIGQGFYGTYLPLVVQRNILENPSWYTSYTPYQAEISQGRLEALINYQTLICELTAMEVANASLLDEGTALAEAVMMMRRVTAKKSPNKKKIFVDKHVFKTSLDVVKTRSKPLGIEVVVGDIETFILDDNFFACLLQTPDSKGEILELESFVSNIKKHDIKLVLATDLSFLCLMKPYHQSDVDVVIGSSQRFGLPLGYGGPHSAFFATKKEYIREIPGRIIGVSKDANGDVAYRMMLQTREQHIKRERATSNICTSQVLLAILSSFYAIYHQKKGLIAIAEEIFKKANLLKDMLLKEQFDVITNNTFCTIHIQVDKENYNNILIRAKEKHINLYHSNLYNNYTLGISIDETHTDEDMLELLSLFSIHSFDINVLSEEKNAISLPKSKQRHSKDFLNQHIFNYSKSETELLRYIKSLEKKDMSLADAMIPLGSCTMKLNSTSEMLPISNSHFNNIHPHAPISQVGGYLKMINTLGEYLKTITQFSGVSFQPNSGASGEYLGLLMIREYHLHNKDKDRNVIIVPSSSHGTNPASAMMCGFRVVGVKSDEYGNIPTKEVEHICSKIQKNLAGIMITYPSTHGIFEKDIQKITSCIHQYGGLVYMDGANLNAQVCLTSPRAIGADVCHINLHKTFSIPHGGGGPGMGPVLVNEKLEPFLPTHSVYDTNKNPLACSPISSSPFSSASILLISYMYIQLLGDQGCKKASQLAILNANYMAKRLKKHYPILYTDSEGRVGHEFILDLNEFSKALSINAIDIAKRIIDYSFHPPTVAFPIPNTIMIEPTESESKEELDRFCDALISIRNEIKEVENGVFSTADNVLKHSPFSIKKIGTNNWEHAFDREKAAFPVSGLYLKKTWASISRIDDAYGDRNIFCTCPDMDDFR